MKAIRVLLLIPFVISLDFGVANGQGVDGQMDRLAVLQSQFEELKEDLDSGQDRLDARYAVALKGLEKEALENANLDLALAVREEAERLASGKPAVKLSEQSALARIQKVYLDERERIGEERKANLGTLLGGHLKRLVELRDELTKAGALAEAVTVQKEIDKLGKEGGDDGGSRPVRGGGDGSELAEILTSRKWFRYNDSTRAGIFRFGRDGSLRAQGFKSSWRRWEVERGTIHILSKEGRAAAFQIEGKGPYTLRCVTADITQIRFVSMR